ncbi:BBE domain-containing protein [Streptomyces sp. NPDC006655]|uniref:BBE domain-containing protein n=1 Tax=Streptomyces sp. NPDC006655 TaxID=3156898 RepID=UPI003453EFF8
MHRGRLGGPGAGREAPRLGAGDLPGHARGDRRGAGGGRGHRRLVHQLPGHRPGRPAWNTSGAPWHTLYFKDNYPRLQRIKAADDPADVFRHPRSVRLPQ